MNTNTTKTHTHMNRLFSSIVLLFFATSLLAQASYHAFIHAGVGCYYKSNSDSPLKGPNKIDGIYGITLINGAQIGERFYVGVGLGFESLMMSRGWDSSDGAVDYKPGSNIYYGFPVFIDAKWYLRPMTHIVTPYLMLDLGYEAWRNDPFGNLKHRVDQLYQNCLYFNGGFGLHIGRYADVSWTAGLRDVQFRVGVEL